MAHRKLDTYEDEGPYVKERRQFPTAKERDNRVPKRKKPRNKNRSVFEPSEDELRYYYGPRYP